MSEDRISVIEASRLFQVTYSTLFNRSKTHKQGAPVLYHENGSPYYLLSEVKQLLKENILDKIEVSTRFGNTYGYFC